MVDGLLEGIFRLTDGLLQGIFRLIDGLLEGIFRLIDGLLEGIFRLIDGLLEGIFSNSVAQKCYREILQLFSCEFFEISKNTFSYTTPQVAASENYRPVFTHSFCFQKAVQR